MVLRLRRDADVLVEKFRRGVLAAFGRDPAMLRRRFPRLVIASISRQGETGPDRDAVSYGSTLDATSGLAALTGAGEAPVVTGRDLNYPDQVVSPFAAGAIVAAPAARDRRGEGAHLDLSQRELVSFLLGEEIMAAAAGAPSPRRHNAYLAEPAERVVRDGAGWRAEWRGGAAPARDGAAVVAAVEFIRGAAVMRLRDGKAAKGLPFRFGTRPPIAHGPCPALGADNRAVLAAAGLTEAGTEALEAAGVLAEAPRAGS
jgi:crotonobetainyl-CoA:carnitine CoA-transferase CaiB-like acyl-CoA transferase